MTRQERRDDDGRTDADGKQDELILLHRIRARFAIAPPHLTAAECGSHRLPDRPRINVMLVAVLRAPLCRPRACQPWCICFQFYISILLAISNNGLLLPASHELRVLDDGMDTSSQPHFPVDLVSSAQIVSLAHSPGIRIIAAGNENAPSSKVGRGRDEQRKESYVEREWI